MKYILALDLSLKQTGYTIADEDNMIIELGTVYTSTKHSVDKRLKTIWDTFEKVKIKYSPKVVIIERGFSLHNIATQQLFRVHGIINLLFQGIEQVYVAPTSLKKLITGSGRSKKDEVRAYIQKQYPFIEIKNDDESDSLALFYYYTKMLQGKDAN